MAEARTRVTSRRRDAAAVGSAGGGAGAGSVWLRVAIRVACGPNRRLRAALLALAAEPDEAPARVARRHRIAWSTMRDGRRRIARSIEQACRAEGIRVIDLVRGRDGPSDDSEA